MHLIIFSFANFLNSFRIGTSFECNPAVTDVQS